MATQRLQFGFLNSLLTSPAVLRRKRCQVVVSHEQLLTDIGMPGFDGRSPAREGRTRTLAPNSHIYPIWEAETDWRGVGNSERVLREALRPGEANEGND